MFSLSRRRPGPALAVLIAGLAADGAHADIAIDVTPGAPDNIFPNASTTHGWQFSVNLPIEVTHLGLYDRFTDGFFIPHPIGVWDDRGALLAEDVISAGAGDLLIDNFRYVDITDNVEGTGEGLILSPGATYTIGFFSASFNQLDGMVIFDGFHTVNPVVEYGGVGYSDFTDGLEMPVSPDDSGTHRWGPNFQFNVIPSPWALPLLMLAGLRTRRRRA